MEYCLQALLSHSTLEEQCQQLITALPLFSLLIQVKKPTLVPNLPTYSTKVLIPYNGEFGLIPAVTASFPQLRTQKAATTSKLLSGLLSHSNNFQSLQKKNAVEGLNLGF